MKLIPSNLEARETVYRWTAAAAVNIQGGTSPRICKAATFREPSEMLWPLQTLEVITENLKQVIVNIPWSHQTPAIVPNPEAEFICIRQRSTIESCRIHWCLTTTGLQPARNSSRASLRASLSNHPPISSAALTCRTDLWYWRAVAGPTNLGTLRLAHGSSVPQTIKVLHKRLCTDGLCTISPARLCLIYCIVQVLVPHPPEFAPGVICDGSFALPDIHL